MLFFIFPGITKANCDNLTLLIKDTLKFFARGHVEIPPVIFMVRVALQ